MGSAVHYAGELLCRSGKRGVLHILGGYAACCYGPRAERIRRDGRNTHERAAVTCKACLAAMAREDLREECGNCRGLCEPATMAPITVPWETTPLRWCPDCTARGVASGILAPRSATGGAP